MQARPLATAAAVLVVLVVGAQLAFTPVGLPVGTWWDQPVTAAAVSATGDADILEVAASGGSDGGAVGWIAREDDRHRVVVVPVEVVDGRVSLGERRTVTEGRLEIQGLDVAASGDEVAVTWERTFANDVVFHRLGAGRPRVISDDPLRVVEPSVALTDRGAVVAWQQWAEPGFEIELAAVVDGSVSYRRVPVPTGGTGSPTLIEVGDGFAVTWFDGRNLTVRTAFGELRAGRPVLSPPRTLGQARPSGGFGGGTGPMSMGAGAHGDVTRGVWLDLGTVTMAETTRDGTTTEPIRLGRGDRPGVGVSDGRWLVTFIVTGREVDTDLVFNAGGELTASGTLSRFPSSANHPSPFFAPEAAVAWSERGAQSRVLVSRLRQAPDPRYRQRLLTEPGRIVFIGVAAAVLGLVSLPVMPWIFLSMLAAFYFTNRFVRDRVARILSSLSTAAGHDRGEQAIKRQLAALPPLVWAAAFAVGEVGLLVYLLPAVGASTPLTFAGPVTLSVGAALGTVLLQFVSPQRSPWRIAVTFAYFQNAALWATAMPAFL